MRLLSSALAIASALSFAVPTPAIAGYGDGVAAYSLQQYDRAHQEWLPLARLGDMRAQYRLGLLFELGRGVVGNPEQAFHWYQAAAEQGHAEAQYVVGMWLARGTRVPADTAVAWGWLLKAADGGHGAAQFEVGAMLARGGDGVVKDYEAALDWFARAAENLPAGSNQDQAVDAHDRLAEMLGLETEAP